MRTGAQGRLFYFQQRESFVWTPVSLALTSQFPAGFTGMSTT
jgi:hypothetical protein